MTRHTLSEIWIYPIKSLAGIRQAKAKVKQKGLEFDRRWMLVDEQGRFLTQREHPEMSMFRLTLDHTTLTVISNTTQDQIKLDLIGSEEGEFQRVVIWDDQVEAIEPNPRLSHWFSDHLKVRCRLVFFPEPNRRDVDPDYAKNREQVSLADGYPFLIIGQPSLDDLNKRLASPIKMNRFRPNFVFTGGEAYKEDTWKHIRIGKSEFMGVKPCGRCVLTTVNPETGVKEKEPLATLSTYRKKENKILFGQNLVAVVYNEVYEGDEIEIS